MGPAASSPCLGLRPMAVNHCLQVTTLQQWHAVLSVGNSDVSRIGVPNGTMPQHGYTCPWRQLRWCCLSTGSNGQHEPGGDQAMTAAQHAAGRLRQGHLAFAPVLRPDTVSNAGSAAAGSSAEAFERKRNADGSVKIAGGETEPHLMHQRQMCISWLHALAKSTHVWDCLSCGGPTSGAALAADWQGQCKHDAVSRMPV